MVEFRIVVQFLAIKSLHKSLPSYGLSKTPCHKWRATVRQINQSINPSISQDCTCTCVCSPSSVCIV